ncbi:MAG: precorrin-3B C(17)-methyltransferase [Prevotellaceae bacterium]|nr:precorrin-3B C(17)-methyltransferase [Prevotellaceae bacterium]
MGKIIVAGIGPGGKEDITPAVREALRTADVIVGYRYYFRFVEDMLNPDALCIDTGMTKERERAEEAFSHAEGGKTVCVVSSGDSGIYGMAPLILEMKTEKRSDVAVEVLPGVSAFQKAAALLGAPVGHDFCVVSLSDLMTPWEQIEKRIVAAASADFVTAVYNPKSKGRYWQLYRLKEVFLKYRSPSTPVGYVRQAGREEQAIKVVDLEQFDVEDTDMFTVILIGNSRSYVSADGGIVTPRGYYREEDEEEEDANVGRNIMIRSFRTIEAELKNGDAAFDKKWALLHAIHTTADFEMETLLYADPLAVKTLYDAVRDGRINTVITDVTMAAAGIRKGAIERLGVSVKCYLHDERVADLAKARGITRAQAGIRLAAEEHPDALYVFGNAPTALMELCELIRKGKAAPAGIVAAPVGFVNVCESKYTVKSFANIPKVIIEGRKGGSGLAATLVNAILTLDDAEKLQPGRDV